MPVPATGGHDHAVLPLGERPFREPALLDPEGTVRDVGLDPIVPQQQGELLAHGARSVLFLLTLAPDGGVVMGESPHRLPREALPWTSP